MKELPIGLQMYSVRDEADRDYKGTLEKVAAIGYRGVEIGWPAPLTVDEWYRIKSNLNLDIIANFVPVEELEKNFDAVIEFNRLIRCNSITCPYLPDVYRIDANGYLKAAETFNHFARKCKERGIKFFYHNHSFEFRRFDGKYGLDILFENTDPELVMFELDTYWVKHGGEDPAEYIKKFSGRCEIVHIKDMTGDQRRTYAEIGEGILDFRAIFNAARRAGTRYLVVEQDDCDHPPLESVKISLENIKRFKF